MFDLFSFLKTPRAQTIGRIIAQATLAAFFALVLLVGIVYLFREPIAHLLVREYLRVSMDHDGANDLSSKRADTAVEDVVARANPAVVSIVISKDVPVLERYFEDVSPFGGFFGDGFSFQVPQLRQKGVERREVGGGSGFLVSADGLVVTNKHVVDDDSAEYTVLLNDGKKIGAKVLAQDPILDLAVLKLNEEADYPFLTFGSSADLKLGQSVIAIGNALGEFRNSVSVGVISGLARSVVAGDGFGKSESLEGVIQTDAAINPGNSGGPLLDLSGRVIGVNVAVAQGSENIGFALPADAVREAVESVKKQGSIVRPFIGVRYLLVTPELAKENDLPVDYGALVARGDTRMELAVVPGSPADKAGIVENDIILSVDGVRIDAEHPLSALVQKKQVGDTLSLELLHRGEKKTIQVKLEAK